MWLTLDGQYVMHPAYNADRSPVKFVGVRLQLEIQASSPVHWLEVIQASGRLPGDGLDFSSAPGYGLVWE
jgi:hypothetical protein